MSPSEPIHSRSNPLLKRLRALKHHGAAGDLMLLEGVTLIDEALRAGIGIVEVAVSAEAGRSARHKAILRSLEERGLVPRWLDRALLESLSEVETSQGILAIAQRPRSDEDAFYRGRPLVLVVESVQNPGNVGALLRVAEAAGATGVYLTRGSADPFSWKALRGAMGSAFRLPSIGQVEAEDVLVRLRRHGVGSVATVATGGVPYDEVDLRGPVAIWLGNEGAGLPSGLVRQIEHHATIPMAPPVESLNVAVAAGLLLFEARRQRKAGGQ